MDITSLQNPRVKAVVRLRGDRRQRNKEGLTLVEGRDEIALALASGLQPRTLFVAPELATRPLDGIQAEVLSVSRAVFAKISYRENPDGWLALFPTPHHQLDDLRLGPAPFLLLAESVEKPGNLGAMLRTADAAGLDALLVCDPRTDLYNPNVVRASRGALFCVPTVQTSSEAALDWLKRRGIRVLAASPQAERPYSAVDLTGPVCIAVGTEDAGLSDFWMQAADLQVQIPMMGRVNSLNVSAAAAILVYEALRQRRAEDQER